MRDCLDEDSILGFVHRKLDVRAATAVAHHLAACAACRRLVSELAQELPETAVADTVDWRARTDVALSPSASTSRTVLARGAVIDRYLIVSMLGRGGMGVVYSAYDPDLNRRVALKLVGLGDLHEGARDQARQRMLREAQALAQLSHPNVVVVHDVGTVGDDVFIAMELIEGTTLRAWLHEERRSVREILRVFRLAGEGLAAAHDVGIVHRDFKPDNVMVGTDGRVRVLDFGLARLVAGARASRPSLAKIARGVASSDELTQAGTVLGTPAYMSPEQDAGEEAGPASDQFSFCVALYEALYEHTPYAGTTYLELAQLRASGEVVTPPKRTGVASRTRRAVLVGLRPNAADRHSSLNALIEELAPPRWTSPRTVAIAAACALLVGVGGTLAVARSTAAPGPSCAVVAEAAEKVWNPTRRGQLVTALGKTSTSAANDLAARLDRWMAGWIDARTRICQATQRQEHARTGSEQLQCLDRRLSQLDAVLVVFTNGQLPEVLRADEFIGNLGSVEDCRTAGANEPTDAEKAAIAPVFREITDAAVAARAGKLDDALQIAQRSVAQARTSSRDMLGLANQTLAKIHGMRGELAASRKAWRDAAMAASETHSDELVVDAWLGLIRVSFQDRVVDDDVKAAMFAAQVAVARLPETSDRHAQFHFISGSVQLLLGKAESGIAELEDAIARYTKLGAQQYLGDIAQAQNPLGMAYALRGDFEAARKTLTASWDGMVRTYGLMQAPITAVKRSLATVELAQEHYEEAAALAREALDIASKPSPESQSVADAELQLANIYSRWPRCDNAKRHTATARRLITKLQGKDAALLALVDLVDARCVNNPRAAAKMLTRARTVAVARPVALDQIAEIDFALAQTLDRTGEPARAIELARAASAAFAALGSGTGLRVKAIDRWLAARH